MNSLMYRRLLYDPPKPSVAKHKATHTHDYQAEFLYYRIETASSTFRDFQHFCVSTDQKFPAAMDAISLGLNERRKTERSSIKPT
jgi:hypothetical protein